MRLRAELAAVKEAKRAEGTRRAYASDWKDFAAWCASAGRSALPASADTLQLYLMSLADEGRAIATIERRCAAIAARHLAEGHSSPVDDDVRVVLGGLRRKLGTARRNAKAAIQVEELRAMLRVMPRDARGARDGCLLLIGFASGLRRSELARLDVADVEVVGAGLVVHLARSKTDQEGEGRYIGIHRGKRVLTCPVRAFERWAAERGHWPGPLFCRMSLAGAIQHRRLSGEAIADVVKTSAQRAGLDPARYGGHSLRAGCATAGAQLGASAAAIMGRTGHQSEAIMRKYIRHATLFDVDPLEGAL